MTNFPVQRLETNQPSDSKQNTLVNFPNI